MPNSGIKMSNILNKVKTQPLGPFLVASGLLSMRAISSYLKIPNSTIIGLDGDQHINPIEILIGTLVKNMTYKHE
jgi:hypothetical protein